jgi:hypothetical protein
MNIVEPQQRIASAFVVIFGQHGSVTQYAQERGVCRQWVYREAEWVQKHLADHEEIRRLRQQVRELTEQNGALKQRLAKAVVIDADKQAEFASVGQAIGVSLPASWALLDVLIPGQQQSVPTLGRRTQASGKRAGELLAVLDEQTRPLARELVADEIYVKQAVLMTVEPESLCWLGGKCTDTVNAETWSAELGHFAKAEQVTRDGGTALAAGIALVNQQRQESQQSALGDQGDHFHALRLARGAGLHWAKLRASWALAKAEKAQQQLDKRRRQGLPSQAEGCRASIAWKKATQAMDRWSELEETWKKTKEALLLFTPEGELNTRQRAEAALAETLPKLPTEGFDSAKRALQKPEMLHYLDRVQDKLKALPFPAEVTKAAVQQEGLRRRPELLRGDNPQAAARRGVLLMCAVILSKVGEVGEQAKSAVRDIFRRAWRASSLVECINSVLRMQQSRHRRMSQGLIDLKRLYWNCHTFRTGRRRKTTPYQRLGLDWPEGLRWWDMLKLTPEQLREKLSTAKKAK